MKKTFLIAALAFAGSLPSFAWNSNEVVASKHATPVQATSISSCGGACAHGPNLRSGYKGFVDVGYVLGCKNDDWNRFEVATVHGVQINPYLFTGVGAGAHFDTDGSAVIPVFAAIRGTYPKGRVIPFVDFRAGYSFKDAEGFYMNPSIGLRFPTGNRTGLNLSIGYVLQKSEDEDFDGCVFWKYDITSNAINLKLSIDF